MAISVQFPDFVRVPIAEPGTGLITRPWVKFLEPLWKRTGGHNDLVDRGQYDDFLATPSLADPNDSDLVILSFPMAVGDDDSFLTFLPTMAGSPATPNIVTVTANYTVKACDDTVLVNTTSGSVTVTLPQAVVGEKDVTITKLVSANRVDIVPTGSDTLIGTTKVQVFVRWTSLVFRPISGGYIIT